MSNISHFCSKITRVCSRQFQWLTKILSHVLVVDECCAHLPLDLNLSVENNEANKHIVRLQELKFPCSAERVYYYNI